MRPISEKLYNAAWQAVARCTNKDHPSYEDYGGRGIKVHPPWVSDIKAFRDYLLTLPGSNNRNFVLDRANNDGHYEPGNLRFVSHEQSANNKRKARPSEQVITTKVEEQHIPMFVIICKHCGKKFQGLSGQRFCKHECWATVEAIKRPQDYWSHLNHDC